MLLIGAGWRFLWKRNATLDGQETCDTIVEKESGHFDVWKGVSVGMGEKPLGRTD